MIVALLPFAPFASFADNFSSQNLCIRKRRKDRKMIVELLPFAPFASFADFFHGAFP